MNAEVARIALQFMGRVQLTGNEVQAYQAVVAAITQYANQEEQKDGGGQSDE
jgi:hypothetical protein